MSEYLQKLADALKGGYSNAVDRTSDFMGQAANYRQSLAQMLDPKWQAEMRQPQNMAALNKQTSDFAMDTGMGFVGSIGKAASAVKTQYELAHELAQRNAALPIEQGGLGLPVGNSAMDRASAMGFNHDGYHGTNQDIKAFDPEKSAQGGITWYADHPAFTDEFINGGNGGGNVIPLKVNRGNAAGWKEYDQLGIDELAGRGYNSIYLPEKDGGGAGFVMNPNQLRSRFAAFDPMRRDSADLLAGVAAAPAGMLGNLYADDQNRMQLRGVYGK